MCVEVFVKFHCYRKALTHLLWIFLLHSSKNRLVIYTIFLLTHQSEYQDRILCNYYNSTYIEVFIIR